MFMPQCSPAETGPRIGRAGGSRGRPQHDIHAVCPAVLGRR
jgi:hypothetical protein